MCNIVATKITVHREHISHSINCRGSTRRCRRCTDMYGANAFNNIHTISESSYIFFNSIPRVGVGVEPCTTVRLTTRTSWLSRRMTSSSLSTRKRKTRIGWRGTYWPIPEREASSRSHSSPWYQTNFDSRLEERISPSLPTFHGPKYHLII